MKGGEVLGAEIVDVAGCREADRGGVGGEPDGQVEIAIEQAVNEAGDKRIAGPDAVDDLDRVARRVANRAACQQEVAGFLAGEIRAEPSAPDECRWCDFAGACSRYRVLLLDQSTFSAVTVEELLDANVLSVHTATALRKRYIPRAPAHPTVRAAIL